MATEAAIIDRIRRAIPSRAPFLRLGIGDDAAVVHASANHDCVITCDSFVEGRHFLLARHEPESVGFKSLARAVSDIAALGAVPRFFLLALALPPARTSGWLTRFLAGMGEAARHERVALAGGDVTRHAQVIISVTVLGEVKEGQAITRSGARPGDSIYVSGILGAAELGLKLLLSRRAARKEWQPFLRRHCYPASRVDVGRALAMRRLPTAMIDTSDGLSTDLAHLCAASGVGARVHAGRLPIVRLSGNLRGRFDPLALALDGGDDYELLFTVPQKHLRRVPASVAGVKLTRIGEITRGSQVLMVAEGGRESRLVPGGWDHFRSR